MEALPGHRLPGGCIAVLSKIFCLPLESMLGLAYNSVS